MPLDKAYLGAQLVGTYDERHFGGPGGQFVLHKDLRIMARLIGAPRGMILDIPCGTGIYSAALRQQGYALVGADASGDMLHLAQNQAAGLDLLQADIHRLPVEPGSLAGVIIIRLFQHLTRCEFQAALEQANLAIRPDGWILFDTLRWSPRRVGPEERHGMHVYSLPECRQVIKQAGLKVRASTSAYLFSAIRCRRLPVDLLKLFERVETSTPAAWRLRTFWLCGR